MPVMRLLCILVLMFLCVGKSANGVRMGDLKRSDLSPFVRRSLGESTSSIHEQRGSHFKGRVPRVMASTADCSTNAAICSDTTTYAPGSQCCGSTCVNLQTDKNHCGHCSYSCGFSLGCCGGICVNLQADNSNCGACGAACSASLCSMGLCGYGG